MISRFRSFLSLSTTPPSAPDRYTALQNSSYSYQRHLRRAAVACIPSIHPSIHRASSASAHPNNDLGGGGSQGHGVAVAEQPFATSPSSTQLALPPPPSCRTLPIRSRYARGRVQAAARSSGSNNGFVSTTLLNTYCKLRGSNSDAQRVFDEIPHRNAVFYRLDRCRVMPHARKCSVIREAFEPFRRMFQELAWPGLHLPAPDGPRPTIHVNAR